MQASAELNMGLKNTSPPRKGIHAGNVNIGQYTISTTLPNRNEA